MNKAAVYAYCVMALVFATPALTQAAGERSKPRAVAAKKQPVLKAARAVPGRIAMTPKSARRASASKKTHGLLVRRAAGPRGAAAVPVVARSAVLSQPVVVGDVNVSPSSGGAPAGRKPLPQRMYAADGDSFYFNGRKYRVEGVPAALAKQEFTKQRLQRMLDSGEVSIEPRAIDEGGLTTAVIRVAGKDVAESLR